MSKLEKLMSKLIEFNVKVDGGDSKGGRFKVLVRGAGILHGQI